MKHFSKLNLMNTVNAATVLQKQTLILHCVKPLEIDGVVVTKSEFVMNFGRMSLGVVKKAGPHEMMAKLELYD